jgi:methyltransferase (TIGR00027 family)
LFRALEARRGAATRVADDRLAVHFLTPEYRLLAELARIPPVRVLIETVIDRRWPCARAGVVARTGLLDQTVVGALPCVEQVLLLGAGFDSRPYRLPGMDAVRVFEVDHPNTQAAKRQIVSRLSGRVAPHVTFVPVVFGRDDPGRELAAAGFVAARRTLTMWEGVTNYLTADAVDATFRFLGDALGPASPVLFTYVDRGMLDGTAEFDGAETTMQAVQRVGEPFTFGFDPPELPSYLGDRGFRLDWDVPVAEAAVRFYAGRRLPPVPAYYHVVEAQRR